jgi:acyl carrier protein
VLLGLFLLFSSIYYKSWFIIYKEIPIEMRELMKSKISEHILCLSYFVGQGVTTLDDDFKLIDSGIITSIDIVNLVNFLEQSFNIEIFVEDVTPDNFQTVNNIEKFIASKLK